MGIFEKNVIGLESTLELWLISKHVAEELGSKLVMGEGEETILNKGAQRVREPTQVGE